MSDNREQAPVFFERLADIGLLLLIICAMQAKTRPDLWAVDYVVGKAVRLIESIEVNG